jgi:oxygen-independent coproporphyrinogen-3 oxidase
VTGPQAPVALYVHVPFCVSICPYCDFVVYAGAAARGPRSLVEPFLAALEAELGLRAGALPAEPRALESVYVGGGTPSLLPPDAVAHLLGVIRERFGLVPDAEVTLEVNPGPDERGDAVAWREAGITRLSIGAQSLDRTELRGLGRRHDPEGVEAAVAEARAAGIPSIGVDLLYDVPDSTPSTWAATLEAALALEPDHLSLYALTLDDPDAEGLTGPSGDHLPTSPGARRWRERARAGQDDDRAAGQYVHAVERLAAAGYRGYEISNWAWPGHESRHNLAYWRRLPYEAVGPGAHAFDGAVRRWNAAPLDRYVAALVPPDGSPGRLPPGGSERIDEPAAAAERAILALRTDAGLPEASGAVPPLAEHLEWATTAGLVERAGGRIVLTTRGRLLSNELFSRFV